MRRRRIVLDRVRTGVAALEHLAGGLGTAVLALFALFWIAAIVVSCLVGVGWVLAPSALRMNRSVADRERARLSRWGLPVVGPDPLPDGLFAALRDPAVRRELGWVAWHGTVGLLIGAVALTLPLYAVQDATYPLYYRLLPEGTGGPGFVWWPVEGLPDALAVGLLGIGWLAVAVGAGPLLARVQAWPGRRLLNPPGDIDLHLRVAELTATRAGALDAHAAELRRIERALHDGTQNRLVAVAVLIGAANRAVERDPATAAEILDKAQLAAEQALADLRTVVRGILPPVIDDRGLAGALAGLAGTSPVPCRVDVDVPGRCAASAEATVYFVAAEAITNAAKHGGAGSITIDVRRDHDRLRVLIRDDGRGGADESRGSDLAGIRRRVAAYDGRFVLDSPPGGPTTMEVELPCGS